MDTMQQFSDPFRVPSLPARPGHENGGQVALARSLLDHAADLAQRCTDLMYRDPFWDERFGQRGRQRAIEDDTYHVTYLAHALWFYAPGVMVTYTRWLQSVLTPRGMCSRHIAQAFEILDALIREDGFPNADPAFVYLRAGIDALRYDDGPQRAVDEASAAIAARLDAALGGIQRHPEIALTHIAFLADALALNEPTSYVSYLRWWESSSYRRAIEQPGVEQFLLAFDSGLLALESPHVAPAREMLERARIAYEFAPH
jgi:hypothetical protein